ncbi:MAG: hypothetical protein Q7V04_10660 [Deltaproteobacteria bacterium]|nr:hypothetical protein [Deltaproteobacteria bacterium]
MFVPDPGSNPRLILIDGQYVPETPVPLDGKGILDTSQGSSSVATSNSDAQESNGRRQSMKDEFNKNKEQYQQAVTNRQMERDAKASEGQNSGQMQVFLSIMNTAITAGSAARTTPSPSTAGSGSAAQPSNYSTPCQGWCVVARNDIYRPDLAKVRPIGRRTSHEISYY